jgi:prepilin-type processing-associated H-X9-DG protein
VTGQPTSQDWEALIFPYVKSDQVYECPSVGSKFEYPLPQNLWGGSYGFFGSYMINNAYDDHSVEAASYPANVCLASQGRTINGQMASPPTCNPVSMQQSPSGTILLLEGGGGGRFLLGDRPMDTQPISTGVVTQTKCDWFQEHYPGGYPGCMAQYGWNDWLGLPWAGPLCLVYSTGLPSTGTCTPGPYISFDAIIGPHNNGCNVAYCDGHVQWRSITSFSSKTNSAGIYYEFTDQYISN